MASLSVPVLIGPPVVAANEWSKKQKWIGASIVPDEVPVIRNAWGPLIDTLVATNWLVEYDVPTSDGVVPTLAINYVLRSSRVQIAEYLQNREKEYATVPSVAAKYRGSRLFTEKIIAEGRCLD